MSALTKTHQKETAYLKGVGKMSAESVSVDGVNFLRITAEPGWRWSTHTKPVAGGESCRMEHHIYMLAGKMHTRMDDGQEMSFGPGDIGIIPPGHDGWNEGETPAVWLDFKQPSK